MQYAKLAITYPAYLEIEYININPNWDCSGIQLNRFPVPGVAYKQLIYQKNIVSEYFFLDTF